MPRPVYGHAESMPNLVLGYRHRHPWAQFAYALQGVVEVRTDDGLYVAPPQRAVWIPAHTAHRVSSTAESVVRSLYVDPAVCRASDPRCRVLVVDPLLRELIRTFSLLPSEYEIDSASGRLAAVLLDRIEQSQSVDLALPLPANAGLRQLCRSVQRHPERRVALAEWSRQLGISGKTLSRLIVRETGLTFRAWVQRSRLISALPGLESGSRVTDVALDCGYDSLSAFIAAFSALFGVTPGEFAQERTRGR